MFVKRKVGYSALFTNLVRWHADAVSFPPSDIILAHLACPLSYVMFYLHSARTNLSANIVLTLSLNNFPELFQEKEEQEQEAGAILTILYFICN
jgi:hypothetical protein